MPRTRPNWIPSPTQELLLRAGLASPDEAARAREAWQLDVGGRDPLTLDVGTQRLVPLVFPGHSLHRRAWAMNVILLRTLAEVVATLDAAHIELLVLKGAALAVKVYPDLGARPMSDLDILVRPADVPKAIEVLQARGWRPDRPFPAWAPNPAEAPIGHGWTFLRGDQALDVHWYAIPQSCQPNADRALWDHAQPLVIGTTTTRTPHATEHLLHALAHGVMYNPLPPIRWVADAVLLARQPIDWGRLLRETRRRGLVLAVRETLRWLVEHFALEVPILAALEADAPSLIDRWRYAHALHPWHDRETPAHLWIDWWRFAEGRPLTQAPRIFARYCQFRRSGAFTAPA